jgi:hypothetical protein
MLAECGVRCTTLNPAWSGVWTGRSPSTTVRLEAAGRASPHRVHPVHFGTAAIAQRFLDLAFHRDHEGRNRPGLGWILTEV